MNKKLINCKTCGEEIAKSAKSCPKCGAKNKKPIFKKWWFWLIVAVFIIGVASGGSDTEDEPVKTTPPTTQAPTTEATEPSTTAPKATVSIELIAGEAGEYGELFSINKDTEFEETYYIYHIPAGTYTVTNTGEYMSQFNVYSDEIVVNDSGWEEVAESFYVEVLDVGESDTFTIEDGQFIEIHDPAKFTLELIESNAKETTAKETVEATEKAEEKVSTEFKNALKKAKSYADNLHMSKAAIYDQLVSEYGEKFPEDAAQYAMDNLEADWNANALKKAKSYSDNMHMSKQAIYDQLVSEYGEQFTEEEAQYAVDNLNADYKANALAKAKSYQENLSMSISAIYDQLVSEYGEQFTEEEAQYAIDNLE